MKVPLFLLYLTHVINISFGAAHEESGESGIEDGFSVYNTQPIRFSLFNFSDEFDNSQYPAENNYGLSSNEEMTYSNQESPCSPYSSYDTIDNSIYSPTTSDSGADLTPQKFYSLILQDDCTLKTMTNGFIARNADKPFTEDVDPTGFNRSPLHVAIDNRKLKCIRYILNHFTILRTTSLTRHEKLKQRSAKETILLQQEDLRGWRAIEHAIENFPYVESFVLPAEDVNDAGKVGKLIEFAMRRGHLKSMGFLVNLTTRMSTPQSQLENVLKVLKEFTDLPEPNSLSSSMFLDQYLEDIEFKSIVKNFKSLDSNDFESIDLCGNIKTLIVDAMKKDCFSIPRHHYLLDCLSDETIKDVIYEAIELSKPSLSRDIFVAWKAVDKDGKSADAVRNEQSKFDAFLEELKNRLLSSMTTNSHGFYKTLALAFHPEYFENGPLMINVDSFKNKIEEEQVEFFKEIKTFVFERIPSVFVVALHNPGMIEYFYKYQMESFIDLIKLDGSEYKYAGKLYNPKPIDLIACHVPKSYPPSVNKLKKMRSLTFVTSDKCNSFVETRSEALMDLMGEPKKRIKFVTKTSPDLRWEVLHPLFYGATSAELLKVIETGVKMKNKDIILGAARILNEPIPLSIILEILKGFEQVEFELIGKLFDYGKPETDSNSFDEIERLLNEVEESNFDAVRVLKVRLSIIK